MIYLYNYNLFFIFFIFKKNLRFDIFLLGFDIWPISPFSSTFVFIIYDTSLRMTTSPRACSHAGCQRRCVVGATKKRTIG